MTSDHLIRYHGIDHVVLKVSDIERSLHFYVTVLGLRLERVIEKFGIYQLRCGRQIVDLQVLPPGVALAAPEARGMEHLCLLVQGDFKTVLDHLAAHAIALPASPKERYGATGFGTSVYIQDPDGHTIELKADHALTPVKA